MEKELLFKVEVIQHEPGNDQQRQILNKLEKKEYSVQNNQRGAIIRKNYLERHDSVVIDVKNPNHIMGLVEVHVDKEKNTLQGILVLVIGPPGNRKYMFKKYTFSLDDYRKKWRAYDGQPPLDRPWRGRIYG